MSAERAGRPRRRKGSGPVPVGDALKSLAATLGIGRKLSEYGVLNAWEGIVGEQIARAARPERIERGVLYVSVENASWRTELVMRRLEIIKAINRVAGRSVVKDIRFR